MSPRARRELVDVLVGRGISKSRSCELVSVARSGLHYRSRQALKDAPLDRMLQEFANKHPKYGYRQAWAWLRRSGHCVNLKRVYRLWSRAGLALPRRKSSRRRRSGKRLDPMPLAPNEVWATDILHLWCGNRQRLRCLTVVDEFTRECLAIELASSVRAETVVKTLAALVDCYGAPRYLRCDNGSEFTARRTQKWLHGREIKPAYTDPGSPWQNGVIESFHSRFRYECLDAEWFGSVAEARVVVEQYRRAYNRERPHSSLGYRTPSEVRTDYDTKVDSGIPQPESHVFETVPL